jgi:hypothetical protein
MDDDCIDNFQNDVLPHIKILQDTPLKNFIKNKIIVDSGSGLGKFLPLLSFFKPQKIISVEFDNILLTEQKEFANCYFPFLPQKKLCNNIEFICDTMESFVKTRLNYDTVFFFQNWHYMNFDQILDYTNANLVFYTKNFIIEKFDLYTFLKNKQYHINQKIMLHSESEYFFITASKTIDNGDN